MGIEYLGVFLALLIVTTAMEYPVFERDKEGNLIRAILGGIRYRATSWSSHELISTMNHIAPKILKAEMDAKGPNENVLVSLWGTYMTSALVYLGSQGDTRSQLQAAMKFPEDDILQLGIQQVFDDFVKYQSNGTLKTANQIFMDTKYEGTIKPSYLKALTQIRSSIEYLEFHNRPEDTRLFINNWVFEKANVKDLYPPGSIVATSFWAIVDAFEHKGPWQSKFNKTLTKPAKFEYAPGKPMDVQMMYKEGFMMFAYIEELQAKVVSLPHESGLSLFFILPDKGVDLNDVADRIQSYDLSDIKKKLSVHKVKLWMPKFKLNATNNLRDIYESLGLTNAFDEGTANFTGISDAHPLFLSRGFQKTFLEVDEDGSSSGSGSKLTGTARGVPSEETFRVDKPVFVLLVDAGLPDDFVFFPYLIGLLRHPVAKPNVPQTPMEIQNTQELHTLRRRIPKVFNLFKRPFRTRKDPGLTSDQARLASGHDYV